MSRHTRLAYRLAALALVAGCAVEQKPINRVQPNYYDKSFFVGLDYQGVKDDPEFYSQGTLVDVGYGAGQDGLFTSTYAQPLSRVKWQVTRGPADRAARLRAHQGLRRQGPGQGHQRRHRGGGVPDRKALRHSP